LRGLPDEGMTQQSGSLMFAAAVIAITLCCVVSTSVGNGYTPVQEILAEQDGAHAPGISELLSAEDDIGDNELEENDFSDDLTVDEQALVAAAGNLPEAASMDLPRNTKALAFRTKKQVTKDGAPVPQGAYQLAQQQISEDIPSGEDNLTKEERDIVTAANQGHGKGDDVAHQLHRKVAKKTISPATTLPAKSYKLYPHRSHAKHTQRQTQTGDVDTELFEESADLGLSIGRSRGANHQQQDSKDESMATAMERITKAAVQKATTANTVLQQSSEEIPSAREVVLDESSSMRPLMQSKKKTAEIRAKYKMKMSSLKMEQTWQLRLAEADRQVNQQVKQMSAPLTPEEVKRAQDLRRKLEAQNPIAEPTPYDLRSLGQRFN